MSFALIRRLPVEPRLDFIGLRRYFFALSALVLFGSIALLLTRGLNFGVDFAGGILIEVRTDGPADLSDLRERLGSLGLGEVTLKEFGASDDVLINIRRQEGDEKAQAAAIATVKQALGDTAAEYRRTEFVGPSVGSELREAGILATLLSMLGIALYIWFRFEWQFGVAALVALVHDVIGTIGFFSLTQIEFNLAILAAILTVAGYSINDTVVIFDRCRETMRKYKKLPVRDFLNLAINQTLSRTILTSLTTLIALFALYFFGGEVIRGFSAGLIWGIFIGTYSSFGLAVPLLLYLHLRREKPGEKDEPEEAKSPA